jgi:hypothetical protein
VPNAIVDVYSWMASACYPQGNFYPLIDDPSIRNRQFTMTDFRLCSSCTTHSQARLCHYTLRMISNHSERTFVRLRYSLGGDRPSQTDHQTLSPGLHIRRLDNQYLKGGIPTVTPPRLTSRLPSLPPILYIKYRMSISSYSKAPWGLSV